MSKKEIQDYLDMQVGKVQSNCEVVEANKDNNGKMLHISFTKMSNKPYTPWIGDRQLPKEDRTVPRITVSNSLLGCIYGYSAIPQDVREHVRAGYYIHELPFEHCLKPNSKLCQDAKYSNEHWLVRYNEDTSSYRGKCVGKMVVANMQITPQGEYIGKQRFTIMVHADKVDSINLTNTQVLTKGYWEVMFEYWKHEVTDTKLDVKSISADMFNATKEEVCGTSLEDMRTLSMKW